MDNSCKFHIIELSVIASAISDAELCEILLTRIDELSFTTHISELQLFKEHRFKELQYVLLKDTIKIYGAAELHTQLNMLQIAHCRQELLHVNTGTMGIMDKIKKVKEIQKLISALKSKGTPKALNFFFFFLFLLSNLDFMGSKSGSECWNHFKGLSYARKCYIYGILKL